MSCKEATGVCKKFPLEINWEFRSCANMKNGRYLLEQGKYKGQKIFKETVRKEMKKRREKVTTIYWRLFDNNNYELLEELLDVIDKDVGKNIKLLK